MGEIEDGTLSYVKEDFDRAIAGANAEALRQDI